MDVPAAVKLAKSYIAGHPDFAQISSRHLEEAEIDEAAGKWLITISFRLGEPERLYVQVCVDDSTGEILSCTRPNPAF